MSRKCVDRQSGFKASEKQFQKPTYNPEPRLCALKLIRCLDLGDRLIRLSNEVALVYINSLLVMAPHNSVCGRF